MVMAVKTTKRNKFRKKKARQRIFIGCVSWPYGNEEKRMLIAPVPVKQIYEWDLLESRDEVIVGGQHLQVILMLNGDRKLGRLANDQGE
jgi:hypothetical protein